MNIQRQFRYLLILTLFISSGAVEARQLLMVPNANIHKNDIIPRRQWNENLGYCGEISLLSAGLYYGQYVSQYDARAIAVKNKNQTDHQLLLGINDQYAASQMRLNSIEWNTNEEKSTDQFLAWVKQNVVKGYPVAIGIFTNEYLFYNNPDPDAGDPEYDHIVPVTGIGTNHSLNDPKYYSDDIIYFSDNGLWSPGGSRPFNFNYPFDTFQANRKQANAKKGPIYSLSNNGTNYGIAITGVMDLDGDTLPIQIEAYPLLEKPEIKNGSNKRPTPTRMLLTITVSNLKPNVLYRLYLYKDFEKVPNSKFNANAEKAAELWPIQITSGDKFIMTQRVDSNEIAVYRAVPATAP